MTNIFKVEKYLMTVCRFVTMIIGKFQSVCKYVLFISIHEAFQVYMDEARVTAV